MAATLPCSFVRFLAPLEAALGRHRFSKFLVLAFGWLRTRGRHSITQALVEAGVQEQLDHEPFHRWFSRGSWRPDWLGEQVFRLLARRTAGLLGLVLDDTHARHKGPHVYGLGAYVDPVRSSAHHKTLAFGNCWVMLSVRVHFPFSRRTWALPVLFRHYRPPKTCEKTPEGPPYRTKQELAVELLEHVHSWAPERQLDLAIDNEYCCQEVLTHLPERCQVHGALKTTSVLHALPPPKAPHQRGRPRKKGERLGTVQELAEAPKRPWRRATVALDGKPTSVELKSLKAMWPGGCPDRPLKIVLLRCFRGDKPYRAFFSTDAAESREAVLAAGSERWSTEVTSRDLKQLFGFEEASVRKKESVERVVPFIGALFSMVVLWYEKSLNERAIAKWVVRPWYRQKQNVSSEDILRAAQRALADADLFELTGLTPKPPKSNPSPRGPAKHAA